MEDHKVEQLNKKAEKKLSDKIRRAKWMVYDGPDVLVVPCNDKDGMDLVFKRDTATNVVGFTNLIGSYPRLVEVIASGKLKVISPKEAQKLMDDQKALCKTANFSDRFQNHEMRKVVGGAPSLEKIANQTQSFEIFKEKQDQEVEKIDLDKEVDNGHTMSMSEVLNLLDKYKETHPEEEKIEPPSIYEPLKKLLSANVQEKPAACVRRNASIEEKQVASPVKVSASASALDELRQNGHKLVDSVVGELAAWDKFRSK